MSNRYKVVAVSGGLQRPSKTTALVEALVAELGTALPIHAQVIHLSDIASRLGSAVTRTQLTNDVHENVEAIESADLLIAASPVYRGSYTGLFKHLFDFVDYKALVEKPVLLAASGGSTRHSLMIDHQMRPLFSFFQALTLPMTVYATDQDFVDYRITNEALMERIQSVVNGVLPWIHRPKHAVLRQPVAA